MTISAGKIAEVYFEQVLETFDSQTMLLDKVARFQPEAAALQNSSNVVWRPTDQHSNLIDGFDISGQEQGIIEEAYPSVLGTPKNTFISQRIDDMRDMGFWKRRAKKDTEKQASGLNSAIAQLITTQGSLAYRSSATNGFDFISEAQTMLDERTNILRMQPIGAGHIARLSWRDRPRRLYDAAADVAKALQQ